MKLAVGNNRCDVQIVSSIPAHVGMMKDKLRVDDVKEVIALGLTPAKALWRSYKGSVLRKTVFVDGKIAAMFGVGGSLLGDKGIPFLLTSETVRKVSPLFFARVYQEQVLKMLTIFPKLENYVLAEYTSAVRLLDVIGFTLGEPEPIGTGEMFIKFQMSR